jgi:hypothetical protein
LQLGKGGGGGGPQRLVADLVRVQRRGGSAEGAADVLVRGVGPHAEARIQSAIGGGGGGAAAAAVVVVHLVRGIQVRARARARRRGAGRSRRGAEGAAEGRAPRGRSRIGQLSAAGRSGAAPR